MRFGALVAALPRGGHVSMCAGPYGPDAVALGLPEVLLLLAAQAKTAPGRRLCLQPTFAADPAECRESFRVVTEAIEAARTEPPPFLHDLAICGGLDEASGGATLGIPELSEVSAALLALEATAEWASAEPQRWRERPRLAAMAAQAAPPPRLLEAFRNAFESSGGGSGGGGSVRLSSKGFARLGARRVRAAGASRATSDAMGALLRQPEFVTKLADRDAQPRRRDGRWVVAAAAGRGREVGTEVARSRSGATAFVEPHALRPLSAKAAKADKQVEVAERRLLRALSGLLAAHAGALRASVAASAQLDSFAARGALARSWRAVVPEVRTAGVVRLTGAVHPLLRGRGGGVAVGNTVVLGGGGAEEEGGAEGGEAGGEEEAQGGRPCRQAPQAQQAQQGEQGLVLTGPNGGGKSIVLQTVGLAALLVRCSVALPCEGGEGGEGGEGAPRCDFFAQVVTDISATADVQAGTSSYVAHLQCCARALTAAAAHGRGCLVLLDEPGASTEPAEGAAVAQAAMETILAEGAILVATTHATPLKQWAMRPDVPVQLAAMQRDPGGAPTYRVLMGAIGGSHALDAAAREGLPAPLLARARALLPSGGEVQARLAEQADALELACAQAEAAAAEARAARAAAFQQRDAAATAAARSAHSLAASSRWLVARKLRLETLVTKLRAEGTDSLELLGATLDSLTLHARDAEELRRRALAPLGLRPLGARALVEGEPVAVVEGGGVVIDGEVTADTSANAATVPVSLFGQQSVPIERSDLAEWCGGAADDFGADEWSWMGS